MRIVYLPLLLFPFFFLSLTAQDSKSKDFSRLNTAIPYTLGDRDRLIRLEEKVDNLEKRMNFQFEQIDKRFEDINKRFEDINKRLEDINDRIGNIVAIMVALIGCFGAMVIAIFSFAYWDRRTVLQKAREVSVEKIREFENNGKFAELLNALREIAPDYPPLAQSLKKFNLM